MDEVKIWALDGESGAVALKSTVQTTTESLLEETLVRNPDLLLPGLRLVGRQTPTAGGPLDLLGVDEDGRLVVFELKKGTLSRDAVAQIIDYASDLDEKTDEALAKHIAAHSGTGRIERIENFEAWYGENIEGQSLDSLRPLRLVLVGLGADARTERMVRFLAENTGMDISLLTFHGFEYEGKTFLARQVEASVVPPPPPVDKKRRLARTVAACGMTETFDAARITVEECWPRASKTYGNDRLSFKFQGRAYVHVRVRMGEVGIIFYPRATKLCPDAFRQSMESVPYSTWRPNREPKLDDPVEDEYTEIQFWLNAEQWEAHKDRLAALTTAVYEAWERDGQ